MKMKRSAILGSLSLLLLGAGCTAGVDSPSTEETGDGDSSSGDGDLIVGDGDGDGDGTGDGDIGIGDGDGEGTGGSAGTECASVSEEATIETEPVDIILVLDNSGSMADELEAVEQNINVNFASILESSGVDYNVILLSRHRRDVRTESGEASTSICVEAPLSGLPMCHAEIPVASARFHQYSDKIESTDSFDKILENINNSANDKYDQSTQGWSEWLRPEAKKVFLEMTDDNEDMPVATFLMGLTTASDQFGTAAAPDFVFHSIIGIAEKADPAAAYLPNEPIETAQCTGNANDVENAGETYQELSIMTGGLRFPLCQFNNYDTVFTTIANDVVTRAQLACDFEIPPPPGSRPLELDKVAVTHTTSTGSEQFGQVVDPVDCQDNAFYIVNEERIFLCPTACDRVRANNDIMSSVDVDFTCEPTFVVVR